MKLRKAELAKLGKALALVESVLPMALDNERAAEAAGAAVRNPSGRVTMASAVRRDEARIDLSDATYQAAKIRDAQIALRRALGL